MRTKILLVTSVALLTLSACGGKSDDAGASSNQQQQDSQSQQQTQRSPGASGKIAAVSGTTLQVQNSTDGQVAVTYSDSTTVTAQVAATAAELQVGDCVTVMPTDTSSSGSGSSGSTDATTVAAATVRIVAAVDGECTGGFGGPGGRPDFQGGTPPTDMPNGGTPPTGGNGRPGGMGLRASGKVTAVTATGFTVESSMPTAPGSSTQDDSTQTVTVTTSDATTWTKTAASDASALVVGKCVFATGDHDSTGAVTATAIQVSDPVDGECNAGFVRRNQNGDTTQNQGQSEGQSQGTQS